MKNANLKIEKKVTQFDNFIRFIRLNDWNKKLDVLNLWNLEISHIKNTIEEIMKQDYNSNFWKDWIILSSKLKILLQIDSSSISVENEMNLYIVLTSSTNSSYIKYKNDIKPNNYYYVTIYTDEWWYWLILAKIYFDSYKRMSYSDSKKVDDVLEYLFDSYKEK